MDNKIDKNQWLDLKPYHDMLMDHITGLQQTYLIKILNHQARKETKIRKNNYRSSRISS